jgi:hypothetical protein
MSHGRATLGTPESLPSSALVNSCCLRRKLHYVSDVHETAEGADAVLIPTDWKQFAELDMVRLSDAVRFPIVIDGRNLYNARERLCILPRRATLIARFSGLRNSFAPT